MSGTTQEPDTVQIPLARLHGAADLPLPQYMTEGASGLDVSAANPEPIVLEPGDVRAIPTGFALAVPQRSLSCRTGRR